MTFIQEHIATIMLSIMVAGVSCLAVVVAFQIAVAIAAVLDLIFNDGRAAEWVWAQRVKAKEKETKNSD